MEFKGTKGEWTLSLPKTEGVILMNGNVRAQVLSFGSSGLEEEDLYNAKLIACAPEMLYMLKDIVEQESVSQSCHDSIYDLIKKATTI